LGDLVSIKSIRENNFVIGLLVDDNGGGILVTFSSNSLLVSNKTEGEFITKLVGNLFEDLLVVLVLGRNIGNGNNLVGGLKVAVGLCIKVGERRLGLPIKANVLQKNSGQGKPFNAARSNGLTSTYS
jgi:hypothetical protein